MFIPRGDALEQGIFPNLIVSILRHVKNMKKYELKQDNHLNLGFKICKQNLKTYFIKLS